MPFNYKTHGCTMCCMARERRVSVNEEAPGFRLGPRQTRGGGYLGVRTKSRGSGRHVVERDDTHGGRRRTYGGQHPPGPTAAASASGAAWGKGLTLVHFPAQPKPFFVTISHKRMLTWSLKVDECKPQPGVPTRSTPSGRRLARGMAGRHRTIGPGRYCSPRRQTDSEPSLLELHAIL